MLDFKIGCFGKKAEKMRDILMATSTVVTLKNLTAIRHTAVAQACTLAALV